MAQGSVVGEEEQALGVLVQPPHGKQAPAAQVLRQQIQHRFLVPVLGGGQQPRRLVEHQIHKGCAVHLPAVHGQPNPLRVKLVLRAGRRAAVRQHPALPDQVLHLPPGPVPGGGQQLVQPLQRHTAAPVS